MKMMKNNSSIGNWVYDSDPEEFVSLCPDFFNSENVICNGCPYKSECMKDDIIERGNKNE